MRLIALELAGERSGGLVFSGLSFSLVAGEALVVTGRNGAGKSTLLRVLAGLLPAAGGSLRLEMAAGLPAVDWEEPGRNTQLRTTLPGDDRSIALASHYLGHRDAMKPALSVVENLRFWRGLLGAGGLSAAEALDRLGLAEIGHAPFGYLSAGQKRRAAIARLLLSPRPIWLLDEPSAGLDASSEARLGELMQRHRENGGIIVAATHQPLGLDGAQELRLGSAGPPC